MEPHRGTLGQTRRGNEKTGLEPGGSRGFACIFRQITNALLPTKARVLTFQTLIKRLKGSIRDFAVIAFRTPNDEDTKTLPR